MARIDISEEALAKESQDLLSVLLKDRTTNKSIVWATHSYEFWGRGFGVADSITPRKVTGAYANLIQPRSEKSKAEQKGRTKVHAEVFTPTWLVKLQNGFVEDELSTLPLEAYVDTKWLEITCGEAPYMVSRYDTVTGEEIELADRVGFVDRKLQRISQEVSDESEFFNLAVRAYKASYGYEYQGDSLLLARENLLASFEDYYRAAFDKNPSLEQKMEIATIISYNVMQMDGIAKTTPYSMTVPKAVQLDLFGEVEEEIPVMEPKKTKLKDWKKNKMIGFERLSSEESDMKFDVAIGNPPYQDNTLGDNISYAPAIYHAFMDESFKVARKVCLITPSRYLFSRGRLPKEWHKKILKDPHFKIMYYEQNSGLVFPNTDIKGGVAVGYRDTEKNFGAIKLFIPFDELRSIAIKVDTQAENSMSTIITNPLSHKFSNLLRDTRPDVVSLASKTFDLRSNVLDKLNDIIFFDEEPNDGFEYMKILGLYKKQRSIKYIRRDFINGPYNIEGYKVFVPKSNGSGAIGEVLSTPLIGHTQTFISIGNFTSKNEAEACLKYVKTKFARVMLGILKATQDNPAPIWSKVPLQDFTVNSDIDWSQSVADIDRQLYKKLSVEEIAFIENNVREMD
ncbi:Eco57I restriction-modification methylase domain-containing protein [Streptococcus sciuri]|nr:Eco57I restriction-modification methylase domain-containing protein [Streptococcus sciuri]